MRPDVDALIPITEVTRQAGLSRTSVYERVAAGTFPQPCRLGTNTRWSEREVQDWIAQRLAERPGQEATR